MIEFKPKLQYYTEAEFLNLVSEFFENRNGLSGNARDQFIRKLMRHFEAVTEHPDRSDVICYPSEDEEDSPEGVVNRVKEWRAANGKPGFKPA